MVDKAAATCPSPTAFDQPICSTVIQLPSWFDMMQLPDRESLLSKKRFLIKVPCLDACWVIVHCDLD